MSVKRMTQGNGTSDYENDLEFDEDKSRDMTDLNINLLLSRCLMKNRC